jgi:ABC-type Fe3+ transport system substrate-binding protein
MLKCLLSTASGLAGLCALLLPEIGHAQVKATYDEIVAAAKREPPVQWCTGLTPKESHPLVAAFKKAYPDVPAVNDFECSGQDGTQRVLSEWKARAPQVDLLDTDTEILQTLDDQNLTLVQDWSIFKGTPIEVDPRYLSYKGRILTVGQAHRIIWYNPKVLKFEDAPKSIEDCANPKYKGILAQDVRPQIFEMMKDAGGPWSDEQLKKWAAGIKANNPLWVRGAAHAYQVLSSGERGLICGQQLHGLFRGDGSLDPADAKAPVQYIIPNSSLARDYTRLAIAPKPLAPNATILFAAFLASNKGQVAIAEVNPGYSSVYVDGSYAQRAYKKFGAQVLRASQEDLSKVVDKQTKIILGEWGFPAPTK